jgi:uncharacterized protein involved in outer membrane biogenesis
MMRPSPTLHRLAMAAARFSALTATRWRRVALGVAIAVALYALVGFFVVPRVVRSQLPDALAAQKIAASVGEVRFNPFLFKLDAQDLRLATADGRPLASVGALVVDFELSSLFRRAWTFKAIRLDALDLTVAIAKDGAVNWAAIGSDTPPDPEPGGAPPRVLVQQAAVRGQLRVADDSGPAPAQASLTALEIDLNDIATLPDREGRYEIEAALPGGGKLGWQGTVSLQPLHSAGTLRLDGLKAATLWPFVLEHFSLREPQGVLGASTHYEVARRDGSTQFALRDTALRIDDLALARGDGAAQPLLALKAIEATGGRFDLAKRELAWAAIVLRDGRVAANVDAEGRLDWLAALAPRSAAQPAGRKTAAPAPPAAAAAAPWRITVDALRVEKLALHAGDASRQSPLAVDVADFGASVRLAVEAGATTQLKAGELALQAEGIAIGEAGAKKPPIALKSLAMQGGSVDLAARSVAVQRIEARGERLDIERAADGSLAIARLFAPARAAAAEAPRSDGAAGAPWRATVETLQLTGWPLSLRDRSFEPALGWDGELVDATLTKFDSAAKAPLQLAAKLRSAAGGTVDAKATVAGLGADTKAELRVDALALGPLQPLLARHASLTLASGALSATAQLGVARRNGAPAAIRASGEATIADLRVDEAGTRERFVEWKSLKATGIAYDSQRNRFGIRLVDVVEPGAKILIDADREVNLAKVIKPAAPAQAGAKASAEPAPAGPPLAVRVGRVALQRGVVDFSDLSLALPFSARIVRFNGSVLDIASDRDRRAQVQAAGEIEPFGSARVEGSLEPFDPKRFLDLKVVFTNVEMPPFSPYTVTFAGRRIAEGKLWLDLEYKIADSQLAGDNKIRLADFKLGERVESKSAIDLPLDLAIALLTDDEGRIDLSVPVRGDVGKPEFDIGALVVQAVVNVIKRIVTAPFRAIGRLLGGGNDAAVSEIDFEAGSARIRPEVRERLQQVASAIQKRPQLKLVVPGPYDEQRDGQALRERRVRVELARALDEPLPPEGEELPPIAYASRRTQRELVKLYSNYAGEDAVRKLLEQQPAAAAAPRAPASGPQAAAAREARADVYEEMFRRIVAAAPRDDAALQALAAQRAKAVRELLVGAGGVPADRVEAGAPQRVEGGAKTDDKAAKDDKALVGATLQLQPLGGAAPAAQQPTQQPAQQPSQPQPAAQAS